MGFFDRVEHALSSAYNNAFARAFKSEVQPVDIASSIRSAMDDRVTITAKGSRNQVPNVFTIELSESDFEALIADPELERDLIAAAEEHAESQRYQPGGPISILLAEDTDLETGMFRVRPSTARHPHASAPVVAPPAPAPAAPPEPAYDDDDQDDSWPYAARSAPAPTPLPAQPAAPATPPAAPQAQPPKRKINPADRPYLDIDGHRYPLMSALTVLGRDDIADIVLDDPGISRQHCEIRVTVDGRHLLTSVRDLGSTNGTFVNGERISSQRLSDGDKVTIGRTSATFRAGRA